MRLTRHAKNRLRWIERQHPDVTAEAVIDALPASETIGYDEQGNRRARLFLGDAILTIVTDEARGVVITVWVE